MGNPLTARQEALIARLYDAALDDALWPQLCRDLAEAFGGAGDTSLILQSDSGAQLLNPLGQFGKDATSAYESYYWRHDIWAQLAYRLGVGQVHGSAEHIRPREFERTEFYADFCRPHDLYHVIGAVLPMAPGEVALLGVHRQRARGPFSDSALLQMQLQALLPHLQRARLAQSGMQERTTRAALDALGTAVLLLDSRLEVVYANASALALFGPGLERSLHISGSGNGSGSGSGRGSVSGNGSGSGPERHDRAGCPGGPAQPRVGPQAAQSGRRTLCVGPGRGAGGQARQESGRFRRHHGAAGTTARNTVAA